MSVDATNATYRAFRELAVLLPTVPPRRRPSLANAQVVALYLAHRYNPQKGYVDETIAQIEAATLVSNGTVRNALRALDEIGWWVVVSSGNRYQAARRVPGFIDVERESDLAVKSTENITYSASLTSRSNTDTQKSRARGSDTYSASYTPLEREPDLAHPRTTYHVNNPPKPPQGGEPAAADIHDPELAAYGLGPTPKLAATMTNLRRTS